MRGSINPFYGLLLSIIACRAAYRAPPNHATIIYCSIDQEGQKNHQTVSGDKGGAIAVSNGNKNGRKLQKLDIVHSPE